MRNKKLLKLYSLAQLQVAAQAILEMAYAQYQMSDSNLNSSRQRLANRIEIVVCQRCEVGRTGVVEYSWTSLILSVLLVILLTSVEHFLL